MASPFLNQYQLLITAYAGSERYVRSSSERYVRSSWCPSSCLGIPIPEAPASDRLK